MLPAQLLDAGLSGQDCTGGAPAKRPSGGRILGHLRTTAERVCVTHRVREKERLETRDTRLEQHSNTTSKAENAEKITPCSRPAYGVAHGYWLKYACVQ